MTSPGPTATMSAGVRRAVQLILEDLNLEEAERRMCIDALRSAGNIVGAAAILKITRHALKRRIVKLGIEWPPAAEGAPSGSTEGLDPESAA